MTGPIFRSVNQHTGEVADRPSKFWAAMGEANEFCKELDGLRELQCRVMELEEELADVRDLNRRLVNENALLRKAAR